MTLEDTLTVYTDGSSYSHPRRGGFGVRIIAINDSGNEEIEDIPFMGYKGATNNAMELLACINGIKESKKSKYYNRVRKILIFTDSMYVVKNYKTALFEWSKHAWRNKFRRPIDNAELWKEFFKEFKGTTKRIEIKWVKGHSKDKHNKAVNKQAQTAAKGFLQPELKIQKIRRKISENKTIIGSIKPEGQKVSIYIVTDEYMQLQKCYKYRCKVITKKSEYYDKIDFLYSKILLNAGHKYFVKLNDNINNPMILKLYRELKN